MSLVARKSVIAVTDNAHSKAKTQPEALDFNHKMLETLSPALYQATKIGQKETMRRYTGIFGIRSLMTF